MRSDKRKLNQIRKTTLKTKINRFAEGSCLISMGHTKVHCTASIEEKVPPFLKGSGTGWVSAEYSMLPRSCSHRIQRDSSKGKVNGRSQEIQRLIGRSLRSVVDMEKLGERMIWIDCDVLQGDGGTRCASITGSFVALYQACKHLKKAGMISQFPIKDHVAAISVGVSNKTPLLDLCYEEDSTADVDLNLIMTGKGDIIEIQGTAEREPFSEKLMQQMVKLGKSGIKELIKKQRMALKQ